MGGLEFNDAGHGWGDARWGYLNLAPCAGENVWKWTAALDNGALLSGFMEHRPHAANPNCVWAARITTYQNRTKPVDLVPLRARPSLYAYHGKLAAEAVRKTVFLWLCRELAD